MSSDMHETHNKSSFDYSVLDHMLSKMPRNAGPSGIKLKIVCDTVDLSCNFPLFITRICRHIMLDFSMGYCNLKQYENGFSVDMSFSEEQYSVSIGAESVKYAEIMGGIFGSMPENIYGNRGVAFKEGNLLIVDFRK